MAYRVKVDRTLCIGAGSCSDVAAKAFVLDKEGKSEIQKKDGTMSRDWVNFTDIQENEKNIHYAAKSCPVNAIIIEEIDEKGNVIRQIWPT